MTQIKSDKQSLQEIDRKHIWHPFTQMLDWLREDPLIIERGEGPYLYDIEGNKYIDGVSSLWVTVHGHKHPVIDEAIRDQLDKIAHSTLLGLSNVPSIQFAEKLVSVAPKGLQRVFYSDAGATAVEIAVKIAFQYWRLKGETKRKRFIALSEAYHGDTLGSVSVGGMETFHETFRPLLFESLRAPLPHCYRCPLGKTFPDCQIACADELISLLEQYYDEVAAVIVEPLVQGAAGIITHPVGYLQKIREACDKTGALLILDEVATGFGRTGKLFACEHENVSPDLLCVAKGISGGYLPLAATLTTETIFETFLGSYEQTFFHGHTYTGNPLACAAAIASLELFSKEKTLEKLSTEIPKLSKTLESEIQPLRHVGEIRQRGFMIGIELVLDALDKTPYPSEKRIGQKVCQEARKLGAILRPLGNVVVIMPPLCLHGDELVRLVTIARDAIKAVTEGF